MNNRFLTYLLIAAGAMCSGSNVHAQIVKNMDKPYTPATMSFQQTAGNGKEPDSSKPLKTSSHRDLCSPILCQCSKRLVPT